MSSMALECCATARCGVAESRDKWSNAHGAASSPRSRWSGPLPPARTSILSVRRARRCWPCQFRHDMNSVKECIRVNCCSGNRPASKSERQKFSKAGKPTQRGQLCGTRSVLGSRAGEAEPPTAMTCSASVFDTSSCPCPPRRGSGRASARPPSGSPIASPVRLQRRPRDR